MLPGATKMINLCKEHFEELNKGWGGTEAIKRAYGDYQIVEPKDCEDLRCIRLNEQDMHYTRCPHCLKIIRVALKAQ